MDDLLKLIIFVVCVVVAIIGVEKAQKKAREEGYEAGYEDGLSDAQFINDTSDDSLFKPNVYLDYEQVEVIFSFASGRCPANEYNFEEYAILLDEINKSCLTAEQIDAVDNAIQFMYYTNSFFMQLSDSIKK